jgi:DNA (cytosine-5)-methyltransferase 1
MSLGFEQAGFSVEAAVEQDQWACETLALNHSGTRVFQRDITQITDEEVSHQFGSLRVDGIVGGPPCQGFSHSNITKRDQHDPRNSLFREFARFIRILQPTFFLMENVPGLLKSKLASGESAIAVVLREFEDLEYNVTFSTLRAEAFGVPQIRERLFIVGTRGGVFSNPLPKPTHASVVDLQMGLFGGSHLENPVTLWDAISDLPSLGAGEGSDPSLYDRAAETDYQRELRQRSDQLRNHVSMKHSKRVVERMRQIPIGGSQSDVSEEYAPRERSNGDKVSEKRYDQNNRRLDPSRPSHTIPASFYANFVHPYQHRNFTPREGARIQSFPDHYAFCGKPTVVSQKLLSREGRVEEKHLCQYVQIGNAVPPKLAERIAANIRIQL